VTYTTSNESDQRVSQLLVGGLEAFNALDLEPAADLIIGERALGRSKRLCTPAFMLLIKAHRSAEQRFERDLKRAARQQAGRKDI
jgi:hypothetical protein